MNQFYQALFNDIEGITVLTEPTENYFSNYWLSCIIIDSKITGFNPENLRLHLEKNNIESRPLWKPMHLQPIFNNSPYYGENVAETLFENGLCLPSGSNLTNSDRDRIESSIKKVLNL
jgi:dTDP-4-amino-4,6-dideoxygalactose transaminase